MQLAKRAPRRTFSKSWRASGKRLMKDMNPLVAKKPICTCLRQCCCIESPVRSPNDTKHSASIVVYGDTATCDTYVKRYNDLANKFPEVVSCRANDAAFRLISISHSEMFRGCGNAAPADSAGYAHYVEHIFKNILRVFHQQIEPKYYNDAVRAFDQVNKINNKTMQISPYLSPAWDLFGTFDGVTEKNIRAVTYNECTYRYYSGYDHRRKKLDDLEVRDTGLITEIRSLFFERGVVARDRKIILQVQTPSGVWLRASEKRYLRYSDISIGISARGRIQHGESAIDSIVRELREEIAMHLPKTYHGKITFVAQWGNVTMTSLDISRANILLLCEKKIDAGDQFLLTVEPPAAQHCPKGVKMIEIYNENSKDSGG